MSCRLQVKTVDVYGEAGQEEAEYWYVDPSYNRRRGLPLSACVRVWLDGDVIREDRKTSTEFADYARQSGKRVLLFRIDA